MKLKVVSTGGNDSIHLVNAYTKLLPCMLCPPTNTERFQNMRSLLEHFTNEHMAIHLYGCHSCNKATTSYVDFVMHGCFADRKEFTLREPKFGYCYALLVCADCGIQFSLNGGVINDQAVREYLSLMAVHNCISMRLVCIYAINALRKDQDCFYVPFSNKMAKFDFLCKSKDELQKCCPKLVPDYYTLDSIGIATFARTAKQFECLELINVSSKIKLVTINEALFSITQAETQMRDITIDSVHVGDKQKTKMNANISNSLSSSIDENQTRDDSRETKRIKFFVFSYDTCVPKDILRGFMFEKDIYECAGCKSIFDNISALKEHYQACQTQNSLPGTFDPLNPHCARLVFNNSLHPSSRIACDKCPKLSFCSFVGLRLHYARDHSIFVNDDHTQISNKKGFLNFGWDIVVNGQDTPGSTLLTNKRASRISLPAIEKPQNRAEDKPGSVSSSSNGLKTIRPQKKKWGGFRGRRSMNVDAASSSDDKKAVLPSVNIEQLKRAPFTIFEHKKRDGNVSLDDVISSNRSTSERSITPANSSYSERPRRRENVGNTLEVDTDAHSRRDLRSVGGSRSMRGRISPSPIAVEESNSSPGSVDNSQRKRPPSERAKRMEQKKLEKERREIEDAEKEDQERETRRRRRARQLDRNEALNTVERLDNKPFRPSPSSDDVPLMEVENGVPPTKKVKKPVKEEVEIIDLSDDGMNESPKEVPSSQKTTTPDSEYTFYCFFCGDGITGTAEFVQHMARHVDQLLQRCPLCLIFQQKEQQFKHVLHVIDHIIEKHIRREDNNCVCPFCNKNFGPIRESEALYLCFQHVLQSCEKTDVCLLCLGTTKVFRYKGGDDIWEHRHQEHTVVYNRFVCSKCMTGFPSKSAFIHHSCNFTHRCLCNIVKPFPSKQAFIDHLRRKTGDQVHSFIKPIDGQLGIYCPGPFRKQLKAMEIEIRKNARLVCPERNECLMFFNKYPHLVIQFEPMVDRTINLRVIKESLNGNQQKEVLDEEARGGQRFQQPPIRKRLPDEEKASVLTEGQKKKKVKRKRTDLESQNNIRKFKYERAICERSNVWSLIAKLDLGDEVKEIADVLEDLVLSVSDPAVQLANGMDVRNRRRKKMLVPARRLPTAQDLLCIPPLPPVLTKQQQSIPKLHSASFDQPPKLYSIHNPRSEADFASSPQSVSPPGNEEGDDDIEIIGEVKSQPSTPKKIVILQQTNDNFYRV